MQASIQRIIDLSPIEGADKIERAGVLGWGVVVKKGEFAPGDLCVFVEIDSLLPEAPWAEFMRPRGFRVKTARLRGCLSQGIVFPLAILPLSMELVEGQDVSEILGVTHYEKPSDGSSPIGGSDLGPFPPVPKTDEVRLQSYKWLIGLLEGFPIRVTVKCDGSSGTFVKMHRDFGPYQKGDFLVCTRNRCIRRPETPGNAFWAVADLYRLEERLPEGYAVQGEVCGPGIQKNRLGLKRHDLFVFQVYKMDEGRYLDAHEVDDFCDDCGLHQVPLVGEYRYYQNGWQLQGGGDFEADNQAPVVRPMLEDFLALAEGRYKGTQNRREGIVVRPVREMPVAHLPGGRLSFKVVSNTYLLRDEE